MRCVIAGGGISGLAVAHELARRGIEPIVLEGERRAGGKVRSERIGRFLCEHGPSGFLDRAAPLRDLLRDLRLEDHVVEAAPAARDRFLAMNGRLVPLPRGPLSLVRSPLLGPAAKARLLGDLFVRRGPAALGGDESLADLARRRFGEGAARLIAAFAAGIYAGDAETLSAASAMPSLVELERAHRSVILGAARGRGTPGAGTLLSLRGGMERLILALSAELQGRVHLRAEVRDLEPSRSGWRIAVSDNGRLEALHADAVVLALPAYAAAPVLDRLSPRAAAALRAIPYAPVAQVYSGYHRAALPWPLDGYGFLSTSGSPLLGATFSSTCFPEVAPDDSVLISARLGGARHGDVVGRRDDEQLRATVHAELHTLVGATGEPRFSHVVRHERALPQYTLGHRGRLAEVDRVERGHPGLFVTGNAFRGVSLPDCVQNAAAVARRVAALASSRATAPVIPLRRAG
jgi:oxygen-dependent protoporphyrinogen oxidase